MNFIVRFDFHYFIKYYKIILYNYLSLLMKQLTIEIDCWFSIDE